MNKRTILVFTAIAALMISGVIWYKYATTEPGSSGNKFAGGNSQVETDLIQLRRLRKIGLDTSIFQDRLFRDLNPPPLNAQQSVKSGRTNPFIPFRETAGFQQPSSGQ